MRWIKRGKIFDPVADKEDNPTDFAQSPQTLVFDDFVRVYYSTRQKDPVNNKYLSHIEFVDFDKNFSKIINRSAKQVIGLGELGTFDEHGIFPINPLKHDNKIWAYTCGWSRRTSVSVETSTGLAISEDNGETFKRYGSGPVLTSSLKEPFLVGDSFVKVINGRFYMWYIFGQRWIPAAGSEPEARVYKIAQATSEDGISWIKDDGKTVIADVLDENECQALPTVVEIDGIYHMYFCYRYATDFRTNPSRGYRLGYAYSTDLHTWTRDDRKAGITISEADWDSEMMCYPHVFKVDDKVYLLYNGNAFGRHGFGLAEMESTL